MATDVDRLIVSLEANIKKYESELRRSRTATNTAMSAIEKRTEQMSARVNSIMSTSSAAISTGFQRIGAAAGAFLSVSALKGYADAWTNAGNKIAAAGEQGLVAARRQSQLADIAIRSRSDFGATVDLYSGLIKATENLGTTQSDVAQVTETVSKAFTVGGQSAGSAAGAILQLNQAFASGKLSGDELNSVLEGAPPLARLIAKEFGVSVGELKKLGESGALTADRVFKAIKNGAVDIERQFATTIPTIANSFTNLNTAITRYVGQADAAHGSSAKLAEGINTLAQNMDVVAPIAAILGVSLLAFTVGGPLGAGLAGLAAGFYLLGDSIRPIEGELATLSDYAAAAFSMAQDLGGQAASEIQKQFAAAADSITAALSSVGINAGTAFDSLLDAVKTVVNATIGTFVFAVQAIQATWSSLGPGLADVMIRAMNSVIATVEAALQKIAGAINTVLGKLPGSIQLPEVKLGQVTNSYAGAGAAAGKAYGEAFGALSKDYVGPALDAARGALAKVRDDANNRADIRAESARRRGALESQQELTQAAARKSGAKPVAAAGGGKGGGKGDGEDKKNDYQKAVEATERRIRALDSERQAVGKSAFEVSKSEAALRLEEAAKKAQIALTPTLRAQIDQLSTAYATATVQLDEARQKQEQFESMSREFGSTLSDSFKDAVLNGEKLSSVMSKLLNTLASKGIDSVFDSLFSKTGAGTGLLGSLFNVNPTGRAGGGPVYPGRAYTVGESGRETFVPPAPGRIVPAGRGGSSLTNAPSIQIDARGSTMSEGQIRGVVAQALQANNAELRRTQFQRQAYDRRAFG